MTRLEKVFNQKETKNKVLVTYTVAGDPNLGSSKQILNDLIASGADILEIGVPFSDPMSEGPVIQKAHERALKKNIEFKDILNLCKQIRIKNKNVPIVLMGYMNSFLSLKNKLAKELNQAGVDGVIVVDLPYDESKSFFNILKKENIDLIRLISPTTDSKRLKRMLASSSGYLYYVSLKGITGAELKNFNEVKNKVKKIKSLTKLPVVVGFGIKDASTAKKMASFLGENGNEITEELILNLVPDFGEGDFFEASEAFYSGKLEWAVDAIDRHFFHGKDARPLISTLQNRNRLLIQLRVLVDGGELDPNQRLSKDQLERIGQKYIRHFSAPDGKTTLNLFSQNPWFLGRLLPLVKNFSTRKLIDLQSNLIKCFEEILVRPKEEHANIFKNLVIQTHSKG